MSNREEYIKKLEGRIRNQRAALRANWKIMEERGQMHRPLKNRWWDLVKRQNRQINDLKGRLNEQ